MSRRHCLLCFEHYAHADTLMRHYRTQHHIPFTTDVYGAVCPACGETFERLDQHASRTHHMSLAGLFLDVRGAGDRRGVVADRVRYLLDRMLTDLESATLGW